MDNLLSDLMEGLTDDEAAEQLQDEFPGFAPDDCDLVCDDCYKKYFE